MKVASVQKIATVYYYVETDNELFPNYRSNIRSESGQWEQSMGESWEALYDEGVLEEAFQEYLLGQPTFKIELIRSNDDGVYHIDDHLVRLTKKVGP